jgi:beta-lactamase regulating signal transducer with metallopeptidase domain
VEPSQELSVVPATERFSALDERWVRQVLELTAELGNIHDVDVRPPMAQSGTKGVPVQEIILALGSAGGFMGVREVLYAWLRRDKSRSIEVRWSEGDKESFVVISADHLDSDAVSRVLDGVADRLGS